MSTIFSQYQNIPSKFLIHIGYHKCASSWLQKELFIDNSVFVPLSKKGRLEDLSKKFILGDNGFLLNSFDLNSSSINAELSKLTKYSDLKNRTCVISDERLSGNPHSGGFDSSLVADRICNTFPQAKVLIVIREQNSWILSNYFQYLTVGGIHGIKKYLSMKYDGKIPSFSPSHVEYHHLIEFYNEKLGSENVLVVPYELLKSDKFLLFETLSTFISSKIPTPREKKLEVRHNETKNLFVNYYFRFFNLFLVNSSINNYSLFYSPLCHFIFSFVKKMLKFLTPKYLDTLLKNKLEDKIASWVAKRYVKSNLITQQLINFDLEKYGYQLEEQNKDNKF